MKNSPIIPLLLLYCGCAGSLGISPPPHVEEATPLASPTIRSYQVQTQHFFLENGLEVLAIRNPSSPMVGLNLAIQVGSAYEDYSTSGMSHMLEHLLFNGTERRTQEELYEETDYYGAYSNAHTDKYFTNFMLLLPGEFLEQGMDIQADMIFNSILPGAKFEKERGIVMEEIRKDRDRDTYAVNNYFQRMNFGETGAGLPTLGTLSTIEHLSRDHTYDFYKAHYVPNNMNLTIIGNFDDQQLKGLLESYYGGYPPRPVEPYVSPQHQLNSGQLNQGRGSVKKATGQVVFEAPPFGSPRHLEYESFTELLNEHLNSALPDHSISAAYIAYPDVGRLVIEFTSATRDAIDQVFSRVVNEIKRIDSQLNTIITDERLALIAKQRSVEDYSLLESPHYYGMMRAAELALGGGTYVIDRLDAIASATSQQVIRDVSGFSRAPHHFNLFTPQILNAAEETNEAATLKKSVLPSGAMLVTSSSGGSRMFGMHILIKNRHVFEDSLEGGAEILHSLLKSGTDQYTQEQLQDRLMSIGATLKVMDMGFIPYDNYYNRPDYGYIRFECLDEDADKGIALVGHILGHTTLNQAKLEQALKDARGRIMMQRGTARFTANNKFNLVLLGEKHPSGRSVSGSTESLSRINLGNLQALQKAYFQPENYLITISSTLSHEDLAQLFNTIWTEPGNPVDRARSEIPSPKSKQEAIIELGKEQAQIRLGYTFRIDPADKPAFALMTTLLSYRMIFDLRETRGLAYTLGISDGYDADVAWLTASIGTGVENINEAVRRLKAYFNPRKLDTVTPRELEKTVNASKGRYMMRNLTRIGQAYYLGYHEYYDEDYTRAIHRQTEYDQLTLEDIKRVAKRYLTLPENHTLVVVK
ncbi:MAG: insulinase family protein [Fidelibacterota bacterium]|nr:MAG: insulinase family protein [Candidatus Neomarinimicrobiota bacterium]